MKRGKDDERMMSPMFPRLHVNDTEKGGPRAPPRNKMALYEQLSIPSQRFSSGMLSSNPHNSSTQGSDSKRAMFFPLHPSHSTQQANNSNATSSDFNPSLGRHQKKLDEEDFAVPIFVQPENGQVQINSGCMDRENVSLSNPAHINRSEINQSISSKGQKRSSAIFSNLEPKEKCHMKKTQGPAKQMEESEDQEVRDHLASNFDRSISYAARHDFDDRFRLQNRRENREQRDQGTAHPLEMQNVDVLDDGSDTSMVDSASGLDIRPDDVVGIIGQKHFWKARKAIVNQQRVFAIQVFELHRLIKVQKLFAASPDLLLEDTTILGKPLKIPSTKEVSLEFIVKPSATIEKHKEDLKNPSDKIEGSAENAVGKGPLSPLQNHMPFSANPPLAPVTTDPKMSPWCPNQPMGHHWLVPVMSPTEGLVYKPYPGPGHTGSNPVMSNFTNPSYGIPNWFPHFQEMGFPFGFPSMSHSYFPPYGLSVAGPAVSGSVVDQGNHFPENQCVGQRLATQSGQLSGSCSGPAQVKNKPGVMNMNIEKTQMGRESELQASTASSPGEGRKNRERPFPASLAGDMDPKNHTTVIRVVPHNAMSANESAFRIFQFIQEERKQHESG